MCSCFKCLLAILSVFCFWSEIRAQESDTITAYKELELKIDLSRYSDACELVSLKGEWTRTRHNACEAKLEFVELGQQSAFLYVGDSLIHQWHCVVRELPNIWLVLGQEPDGSEMTSQYFKIQPGPYLKTDAPDFINKLKLVTFNIELIRSKERLFKRLSMRGRYTSEISQLLRRVSDGDKIVFSDVYVQVNELEPFRIDDMTITIDDD